MNAEDLETLQGVLDERPEARAALLKRWLSTVVR
jgi:flagellar biosynthesis/type III secretory pathway M-ring protein FliF/YscJ